MPETQDGYIIDDSILDKEITVGELLEYINKLEQPDGD